MLGVRERERRKKTTNLRARLAAADLLLTDTCLTGEDVVSIAFIEASVEGGVTEGVTSGNTSRRTIESYLDDESHPTPAPPSDKDQSYSFLFGLFFNCFVRYLIARTLNTTWQSVYLNSTMATWTLVRGFKLKCETGPAA